MGNLLADAASWLSEQRNAHLATEVTYSRGAASVSLSATIGRTIFESEDDLQVGNIRRIESRDFIVRAADLVLDSATVLPEDGDEIRIAVGATTHVFEVLSPGDEPPFRPADLHRIDLRIHTKHIGTE